MLRTHEIMAGFLLLVLFLVTVSAQSREAESEQSESAEVGVPSDENLRAVAAGNGIFARNFYQAVRGKPGNLVVSPLSAGTLLALAWLGAGGATAQNLQDALHLPEDPERAKRGYYALLQTLWFVDNSVTLDIANAAFVRQGLQLRETFRRDAADVLLSDAWELDFGQPAVAAATINEWVQLKTRNKIEKLFEPADLPPATSLVLANAVYFKGTWLTQFDPARTEMKPFLVDGKMKKDVQLMATNGDFPYAFLGDLNARAVRLPYVGGRVSMLILLPSALDGLPALETAMASSQLPKLLADLRTAEVHLWLPKFRIETSLSLNKPLEQLGLGDLFGSKANFTGIMDQGTALSQVVQKAFIEVNEEGSEAAAATGGIFLLSAGTYNFFKADHPFLFYILDDQTGTILFQGRVTDP